MKQGKFLKGFLFGVVLTGAVGAAGWKICDMKEAREMNQGAITDSFVKKAKLIEEIVDNRYTGEIDEERMESTMYKGLMASLGDPYSEYYTQEEYEDLNAETTGTYKGIGVVMQMQRDTGVVKLIRCYEDAPGEKAGLLPEDILVEVNGEDIVGLELHQVVEKVKGSKDEVAHLKIARESEADYLNFDVPLEEVHIPVVEHEMPEGNIGYIALYEFTGQTQTQYEEAFEDLKAKGMERLIIDVRNNPGGLMSSVCGVLENMLPKGLIVYTEDKEGNRQEIRSKGENPLDMPLVVLINENSASASEIFSGAIQDYEMGTLVGVTTFGKGIVQSVIPLRDGSAIKTTTAKYYTPNGRCIHGKGIEPDVEEELAEGLKNKAVLTHEEDNQLQRAMEVVRTIEK